MAMANRGSFLVDPYANVSFMMSVLACSFCILLFLSPITGDVPRPRGVALSRASSYQVQDTFTCLDGSESIPFEQVNDDYCDCRDSSDEPGTSACPNGSFHCTNAGHRPEYIPSSRVNDGICDCCDGTDEYLNDKCFNDCKELGRAAREEAERQRQLLEEGYKVYLDYCIQGQEAVKERLGRKEQLETEKSTLQAHRDELEVLKNEVEKPENEAKDRHKKAWEEERDRVAEEKKMVETMEAFLQLDADGDSKVTVAEMRTHQEFDIDANGEVSPEEAKEYLEDQEEVEQSFFAAEVWPNIREIYKEPVAAPAEENQAPPPPVEDAIPQEPVDDERYYDEEDDYDEEDEMNLERPPFPRHEDLRDDDDDDLDGYDDGDDDYEPPSGDTKEDPQMPEYDDDTKLLIEAADKARDEFNEADKHFKDVENEYKEIEKFLNLDFGPNKEFYSLKDQCFEYTDLQYIYKMCPFEKTTQRQKSGGAENNLGRWGHWAGPEDNKYVAMMFDKGQNCWNGPDRSTKVVISCGITNELVSASEPNRCEYEFQFHSPAACQSPALVKEQHDEL